MALGVAATAYIRFRYDTGHRAFRRLCMWYGALVVVIAGLSLTSNVAEVRCRREPNEFCRYNDSVPAIATIAGVFFLVGVGRAWFIYSDR